MTVMTSRYTRDDVYNYYEVAEIVGCPYGHVVDNALNGNITQVKLPHDRCVYIPKYEIDPLKGCRRIGSKESKVLIRAARKANRDYVAEEHSYGDPFESYPQVVKTLYHENPTTFWTLVKEMTGLSVINLP
jgi:hypothetical protein